jgi:hypothetical protein
VTVVITDITGQMTEHIVAIYIFRQGSFLTVSIYSKSMQKVICTVSASALNI